VATVSAAGDSAVDASDFGSLVEIDRSRNTQKHARDRPIMLPNIAFSAVSSG
jgi:hypothetical protein